MDMDVLKAYHAMHFCCEICGQAARRFPHHLKTRGAGGDDIPENLISLCMIHDRMVHSSAKFRQYVMEVKQDSEKAGVAHGDEENI